MSWLPPHVAMTTPSNSREPLRTSSPGVHVCSKSSSGASKMSVGGGRTTSSPSAKDGQGVGVCGARGGKRRGEKHERANQRISSEIWSALTGIDLVGGRGLSERVMREETASGDDYDEERFTDYIFDANDYTLSDGSHVKVSTAYDYVYEGDNGVVYYSDSAFAQPGGSTELTPNR